MFKFVWLFVSVIVHRSFGTNDLTEFSFVFAELLECSFCEKRFTNHAGLSNHLKTHLKKSEPVGVLCEKCSKVFRSSHYLNRHLQNCSNKYSRKKCFVCGVCGLETVYLENHYRTQHNIHVEKEYYEFKSKDVFLKWKDDIETTTVSRFVRHRGTIVDKQGIRRTYFNCHRGGFFEKRGKNQRQFKATGSNKINGHCPAAMILKECEGKTTAVYIKTHVGHGSDYKRIPLSKREKEIIAKKLANNVSVDEILSEVKDSISDENVSRIHFINRKDIRNIRARHELCKHIPNRNYDEHRDSDIEDYQLGPSSSTDNNLVFVERATDVYSEEIEIKEEDEPLEVVLLDTNPVDVDSLNDLNLLVSKQFGRNVKLTIPKQQSSDLNSVETERTEDERYIVKQSSSNEDNSVVECEVVDGLEYSRPVEYYEIIDETESCSEVVNHNSTDNNYELLEESKVLYNTIDPGSVVYVEYELSEEESLESLREKATQQFRCLLQTADSKDKLLVVLDQITQLNNSMTNFRGSSTVLFSHNQN